MLVPWAIAVVLKKAMSRLQPWRPKPQSLETISCSGAMYSRARRMRAGDLLGPVDLQRAVADGADADLLRQPALERRRTARSRAKFAVGHLDGPDVAAAARSR